MTNDIDPLWRDRLVQLCARYKLGEIKTISQATRGINNLIFIVNDQYAFRFDRLVGIEESRFTAEKIAYDALTEIGVPVPRVIAVDDSRDFASGDVLIMTKVSGTAAIDSWNSLTAAQQRNLAFQLGQAIARMHGINFGHFGYLRKLKTQPLSRWINYVEAFYQQYMTPAIEHRVLPDELLTRIQSAMAHFRPLLAMVEIGSLVHGDAHPENILQQDGRLTGIVDFEWALSGDPSADFQVQDQWDEFCPGSLAHLYEGYRSVRSLPAGHDHRVALYWLLRNLDSAVESRLQAENTTHDYQSAVGKMLRALEVLER